jgi:hypothetical protein
MSEIYEGNSITVNNINKSKAKIKIRGGSYQETTQGKNLFDNTLKGYGHYGYTAKTITNGIRIIAENDFTKDDALFGVYTIIDLSKYIGKVVRMQADIIPNKSTGAGAYRLGLSNKDSTNRKALAETGTKKEISFTVPELIGEQKYLAIWFYIGTTDSGTKGDYTDYTNIIVTIDNDDMTYEPYTGGTPSPNPNYPQEIQNVGDNINVLNKDIVDASNNLRGKALDTGRRLIANKDGVYTYGTFKLGGRELLGKTLGIHADIETTGGNPRISIFAGNSSSLVKSMLGVVLSISGTGYITLPSSLSDELDTISAVLYVTTDTSVVAGTYVDYTNLKVQVGDGEVIYSDYKKGNIQITKCNENYGNAELLYNQMSYFYSAGVRKEIIDGKNCIVFNNTAFRGDKGFLGLHFNYKKNTRYVIRGKFRVYDTSITSGGDLWVMALNKDKASIGYSRAQAKGSEWIQFSFSTNINFSFDHIAFSYGTTAYWCLDMDSLEIYEGTSVREVPKSQVQTITFPLEEGQKLYEGSYLAEDGIHNKRTQIKLLSSGGNFFVSALGTYQVFGRTQKGVKQGSRLLSNYFKDYGSVSAIKDTVGIANNNSADRIYVSNGISTTLDEFKDWLDKCENAGRPVILECELAEEEIVPYTPKQQNAFYELQNIVLYDGINYISIDNELGSMSVEVSKIIEDYETYISSNGFFINSQNDIHYLIDFSESELPCMAEATETTVKAAGRNGDIVLSTTYDPNNFNIVCYTEDNLTQEEKVKEEMKLKRLLNSIKNKTIPLAFEKDDKFYKVKYSGAFSSTNFPKHLKFSIPLKTSEAYGKDLIKKVIFGNGEETSDTFEDVGAIFTIKGPANSPIISLNDYSIEYDNPLLEGDKLIINSSNSTITHINSDGVKTNAMRYYNHQFPKIENGKNVLKVLSGVNEANVSVEWYDYKF